MWRRSRLPSLLPRTRSGTPARRIKEPRQRGTAWTYRGRTEHARTVISRRLLLRSLLCTAGRAHQSCSICATVLLHVHKAAERAIQPSSLRQPKHDVR